MRSLARRDYWVEVQAPPGVEVMLYDQPSRSRLVAHLLARQPPARRAGLSIRLDGRTVRQVRTLPERPARRLDRHRGPRRKAGGIRLNSFQLIGVDYQ